MAAQQGQEQSSYHDLVLPSQGPFLITFSFLAAFAKSINTSVFLPFLTAQRTWKGGSLTLPLQEEGSPQGSPANLGKAPLPGCSLAQELLSHTGTWHCSHQNSTILLTFFSPEELRGGVTGTDPRRLETHRLHALWPRLQPPKPKASFFTPRLAPHHGALTAWLNQPRETQSVARQHFQVFPRRDY